MRPVTPSWKRVGASIGALVLVGMGLTADVAAGQPRPKRARPVTIAAAADEAPGRRLDALLALLPRLERDLDLRRQPDLHRAVAASLREERQVLKDAARMAPLAAGETATADVLMVVGLRLLPHASDETRPQLLSALVKGYYAPGSRFAADLASYGAAIVDDVLQLAGDESAGHRANAYVLMGRVLNNEAAGVLEDSLSMDQALGLVTALRVGLDDDDASVRALTVDALVAAGDGASVRRLTDVARRDMSPMVRQRAREAADALSR
jgi:hypothetical protein